MPARRLSVLGYFLLGALLAIGVGLGGYAGFMSGGVLSLFGVQPILDAPAPPGPGMAPNLEPLVEASGHVLLYLVLGTLVGLAVAGIVLGLICYLVAPLVAQIPGLGTEDTPM